MTKFDLFRQLCDTIQLQSYNSNKSATEIKLLNLAHLPLYCLNCLAMVLKLPTECVLCELLKIFVFNSNFKLDIAKI